MSGPIDRLLFDAPGSHRTDDEWSLIVAHLARSLGAAVQHALEVERFDVVDNVALFCRARSAQAMAGVLNIGLSAAIGVEVLAGRSDVSASIFVFAGRDRLGPMGELQSYAQFAYEDGRGWRIIGWFADVYEEYTQHPAPPAASREPRSGSR